MSVYQFTKQSGGGYKGRDGNGVGRGRVSLSHTHPHT